MQHLADGDIDVQRGMLSDGEAGVDQTVAQMADMAKGVYGARSPKIRALAINIVNKAGVGDKDYYGMAKAIHEWVRDQIRYVKDPVGQETLSYPEETAFNSKAGDCLDANTRLLSKRGYVAIKDVRVGDVIQGKAGWTRVLKVWDKGILPTSSYYLDNGGVFTATAGHRCFLLGGGEKTASELKRGDALLGPSTVELPSATKAFSEEDCYFLGLYLADGWSDGNKTCISGKDGFAKEAQKRWALTYAEGKGWATHWHPRYLTIYIPKDHPFFDLLHDGRLAPEKEIPGEVIAALTLGKARKLLDGLMADSYDPSTSKRAIGTEKARKRQQRSGVCYSTTSPELAKQVRLLFRLQGVTVRDTLVVDHGGLGTHPVHRIYPRYYRPKPAKVEAIEEVGERHVFDIQTADTGIYLPDADIVVHNCDDKTILEIALLGSVGIRSYPVVVGMRKGHFSHVYLKIVIPEGGRPGRHAGEHIPADPIMREWPLGQEAPADRIAAKKTYEDLAGLGTMLNGYMTGPSYIDEANVSSVVPAMRAALVDTASRGEILNAPKVDEHNTDELDDLFQTVPELAWQGAPWSAQGPYGPITGAEASGTYSDLPHRRYERAMAGAGRRSFKRRVNRVTDDWYTRGKASNGVMIDEPRFDEVNDDLNGIGTYIDSIMGEALGADTPVKVAAVASLARNRAALAKHGMAQIKRAATKSPRVRQQLRRQGGFMPGMGELADAVIKKAATLEQMSVAAHGAKAHHAQHLMRRLEATGLTASVDATKTQSRHKIKAIQIALYTALALPRTPAIHDAPVPVNITPPLARNIQHGMGRKIGHGLLKSLPPGSYVRTRGGNIVQRAHAGTEGLGSWFSSLKQSVSKAIKTISAPIAIPVQKAYQKLPTPLKKVLNIGVGIPLGVALSPATLIGESKPVYAINRAALGNKGGGLLTNVERIGAGAAVAAATAGAVTGVSPVTALVGSPTSAGALTGGYTGIPAYAVGAGVDPLAAGAAAATPWYAGPLAAIAAHPLLTVGAIGGAGLLAAAAASGGKKKKSPDASPAALPIDPTTGLPVGTQSVAIDPSTGLPYDQSGIDPTTGLPYGQSAIDPSTGLPYGQSPYDAAAMATDPYGGDLQPGAMDPSMMDPSMMDPYAANYGGPGMMAPVDTFGPQDMGPAVSAPSAADMGPMDDSGSFADDSQQLVDDSDDDDSSADDDATEGSAPAAPARRRRKHRKIQRVTADTTDASDDASDVADDSDDGGSSDGDLDVDTSISPDAVTRQRRSNRDLSGFEVAGVGVGTLALVGLGIYLLTRKAKRT